MKINFTVLAFIIRTIFAGNQKALQDCKPLQAMCEADKKINQLLTDLCDRIGGIK